MFVANEVILDVTYEVARARLLALMPSSELLTASQDAFSDGVAELARVARPGSGAARLVAVKFGEPMTRDSSMAAALRWEAINYDGGIYPSLDADLTVAEARHGASALRLDGVYRPPAGLSAGLDRMVLQQAGEATVQRFLGRVAMAIAAAAQLPVPPDAAAS